MHFKCVQVVSQTIAYTNGAFPSLTGDREAKPPSEFKAHLRAPLLLTWCQAEMGDQINS